MHYNIIDIKLYSDGCVLDCTVYSSDWTDLLARIICAKVF